MLQTAVISGSAGTSSGVQAVTAFAGLLLIFVGSFTGFVTLWRDTLLPPPAMAGQGEAADSGLPPPQFGTAGARGLGWGGRREGGRCSSSVVRRTRRHHHRCRVDHTLSPPHPPHPPLLTPPAGYGGYADNQQYGGAAAESAPMAPPAAGGVL